MFDFQQKRAIKNAFESRITWVVLLVLVGFMIVSTYDRYLIARDMAERRAEVETEIKELEVRKTELESEVEYLSHDRGIEAEMRRQFDIAKEGEQVVIIVEEETSKIETVATTTEEVRSWYRFW